jgi:hypothetical protein
MNCPYFERKKNTLIFLHVPKAAGSTVNHILRWKYKPKSVYNISGSKDQLKLRLDTFKRLSEKQKSKIKLLRGHMPFGLHTDLPNKSVYITFLREPVDRVISEYFYVLRSPSHYLYNKVVRNKLSLDEFVTSGVSTEMNDGQTRLIAGDFAGIDQNIPYGKTDNKLLNVAKNNLDSHFMVCGTVEKFDETLFLISELLGWRVRPYYFRRNVTESRPKNNEISGKTREIIEKHNRLDIELYRWANTRLDEQLRCTTSGYHHRVASFRKANRIYQKLKIIDLFQKIYIRLLAL